MTLNEALALATQVESSEHWTVIAIGRFVLQDELQAAILGGYVEKLPWAVSVMAIGDLHDRAKLNSPAEWQEYSQRAPCAKSHDPPSRQTSVADRPLADDQLLLF